MLEKELGDKDLGAQIYDIADPLAKALSLDVIEVSCQGRGPGCIVRVTIDKKGGVGIDDCERFHQSLSRALDVADPVPHAYRLEVSSPGLDRPLKKSEDFERVLGELVWIKLRKPLHDQWVYVGRLQSVSDTGIGLTLHTVKRKSSMLDISWEMIKEAKLEVEF